MRQFLFFFVKKSSKKFRSLIISFEISFSFDSVEKEENIVVVVIIIIVSRIQNFIQNIIISFQKATFLIKKSLQKAIFLNFTNNLFLLFIISSMKKFKRMMKTQMKIQNQKIVVFISIVVQLILRNKRKINMISISEN